MNMISCRNKFLTRVFCAVSVLAISGIAVAADTKSYQEKTWEEKFEMQEQRIRDLERRLQEMEAAMSEKNGKAVATIPATTPATATAATPAPAPETVMAAAPETDDIEKYTAETFLTSPVLTGDELVSSEFPGSWPMFGTNMRMKIGGYLKTDLLYDFDGTTDPDQFLMSTIPVEGTPEYDNGGYISFFAKETRFNIDVRRVTPGGVPLSAFAEGDFWTSGTQFRLRHAYMTYGDFLIGQTWTTLSFLESLPFMIDFAAGDALFGGRAPQIRYTNKLNDQWKIAVALENLGSLGIENPYDLGGEATAQWPLLAFRADYEWDTGLLLLGASAAQLRWDGGSSGPTDEALQIDGVVAGRQFLGPNNYVSWNVSYGKGSGENIIAFSGSEANGVLNEDGTLDTMPAFSVVLGYWHKWDEQLSSNLSYAYGWLNTPDSRAPLALKEGGIAHVNLIWQPTDHFTTGIEFMYGQQRTQNNALGSASRIQTMAKYDF